MALAARMTLGVAVALAGSGCVAELQEVQLDPAVREGLGQGPPIHVFHYVPKPLDLVRSGLEPKDVYHDVEGVDDPVLEVERALVDDLRREAGLDNLRPAERPYWSQRRMLPRGVTWERASARYGAPMTSLPPEWLRDGLILELETLHWQIDGSGPKRLLGRCTLQYGLRARLVRLPEDRVLWRGWFSYERPGQCDELSAGELRLVKALRPEIARRCAAELTGSFMGRTETTFWRGLNQPKEAPR